MSDSANRPPAPTAEMVARAWHALSAHASDGIALGGNGCTCRYYAPRAKQVVDLFTGEPVSEPDGLGAVVVNPPTDQVYVRAGHPALPWHDRSVNVIGDWADPTCEEWFTWGDLPRPLVVHNTGWVPPPAPKNTSMAGMVEQSEPTGVGAVVDDAEDQTWIRAEITNTKPWVKANDRSGILSLAAWYHLAHPITVRSHGWERP